MSFKNLFKIFLGISTFIIFVPHLFIPVIATNEINSNTNSIEEKRTISYEIKGSKFLWPIPGYTKISSPFGKRNSPTAGASSFHQGIDIPAPPGTALISPCDATVNSIGFKGSAGFTISLKSSNLEFLYHHVSPNYIVSKGDKVERGQIIGNVGPKNVYGVTGNKYKDSKR